MKKVLKVTFIKEQTFAVDEDTLRGMSVAESNEYVENLIKEGKSLSDKIVRTDRIFLEDKEAK